LQADNYSLKILDHHRLNRRYLDMLLKKNILHRRLRV
jgi:hypothetical protein